VPYAVLCPRCGLTIVLEALGHFDCPHCSKRGGSQPPPPAKAPAKAPPPLPLALPPALPPLPPPRVVQYAAPPLPDEPDDDDETGRSAEDDERREARAGRSRAARRKLLLKIVGVAVLAVVTGFTVRAAFAHITAVAENSAAPARK
jgi:hypothetical protein